MLGNKYVKGVPAELLSVLEPTHKACVLFLFFTSTAQVKAHKTL